MKKYVKVFGILSLLCFSFYYTEQIANFMKSKDPIYESILVSKKEYETESVNAYVKNETIIPGLMGEEVNVDKSFRNMKNLGYFSVKELVFDEVKPEVSLSDNMDKLISKGNPEKRGVTLILANENYSTFLEEMGVSYAFLTTIKDVEKVRHYGIKINNDSTSYKEVEKKLKKEKSLFCFVPKLGDYCKTTNKYLIGTTYSLNKSNFAQNLNKIDAGSIIYLEDNLGLTNLKVLLNQIYFRGLSILNLEEFVSESRS